MELWRKDGQILRDAAIGDGPIDAVFNVIDRITGITMKVVDYRIRAVTFGGDAQGEAFIEAEHNGKKATARAVSTDIVEASAMAYLELINRVAARKDRARLKPTDHVPQDAVPNP